MAAFAASGVSTIAGLGRASAQETTPCVVARATGTLENLEPNFRATADRAEFVFLVPMKSLAEEVVLISAEQGGELKEGLAALKAIVTREGDGPLKAEKLQIHWPLTALKHQGQLYSVIGLSQEQNVPVGIVLSAGAKDMGNIVFEAGQFPPDQEFLDFNPEVSNMIHEAIMRRQGFSVRLVSGGNIYSSIQPESQKYEEFMLYSLVPAMNDARKQDAENGCPTMSSEEMHAYLEALESCFLTSACCSVIGLDDRCWELQTLRRFRDGWLSSFEAGRADIARYYREAPAVAHRLVRSAAGRKQLLGLYWRYIVPSALLAKAGANRMAHRLYRRMMLDLLGRPA